MEPTSLITASRLDIFARTALARAVLTDQPTKFGLDIYRDYLGYSSPREHFAENGIKVSLDDYVNEFTKLILSMKAEGFNPEIGKIPVSGGSIVNGAHRLATALVLGLEVETQEVSASQHFYDQRFFSLIGLPQTQQDFICQELIRYTPDAKAFLFFGLDDTNISNISKALLNQNIEIFFKKRVPLSGIGLRRVIRLAYDHNEWWSEELQETMYAERFSKSQPHVDLYIFRASDKDATNFKKTIRNSLTTETFERKIHGTDNHWDTVKISNGLLNPNALHFINNSPVGSEIQLLEKFSKATALIDEKRLEGICFDGSSVMEAYGLRKARDLDYITVNTELDNRDSLLNAEMHNLEYGKYPLTPEQIIYDPRLHFVIGGFKLISIHTLDYLKSFSFEPKSSSDRRLMHTLDIGERNIYIDQRRSVKAKVWRTSMIMRVYIDKSIAILPAPIETSIRRLAHWLRNKVQGN